MIPKNNDIYRHFKGNLYKIITLATHSETGEQMVVYQALYGEFQVYCRPLDMFVSEVDREKYPDITQKYRFERVNELVNADTSVSDERRQQPERTEELSEMVNDKVSTADEKTVDNSQKKEAEVTTESDSAAQEVDPLILEFLDAESIAQKRNILTALHHRITDEMINTLAVVMDVVIEDGDIEDRYQQLKTCLSTIEKYEIERKY